MHISRRFRGGILFALVLALGWMSTALAQDVGDPESVRANVILCVDPDCADTVNIENMVAATITSYDPDGSVVDSCTVTLTQSDMVACSIVPAPDRGSYDIWPADEYVGYRQVSAHPEVFESEMHGPIYVWYFAPEKDNIAPPPTQVPPTAVSELPSTGAGVGSGSAMFAIASLGIAGVAVAASGVRRRFRE